MAKESAEDKARKIYRNTNSFGRWGDSTNLAEQNAKAAGVKPTPSELKKATNVINSRRTVDAQKSRSRADWATNPKNPANKKKSAERVTAAATGVSKKSSVKPKVTATKAKSYNDNKKQPIAPKVTAKILADSKKKAKVEVDKRKAPKTNWITKL